MTYALTTVTYQSIDYIMGNLETKELREVHIG